MTKILKTLLLLISLTLTACSSVDISDKKWEPVFIAGTPILHKPRSEGVRPHLAFKGDILHGIAGDNLFRCEFKYDKEGNVFVGKLASTKIAGLNNKYEKAFLAAIKNTKSLESKEDGLYLYAEDGSLLMRLVPYDESNRPVAPVVLSEAVVVEAELSQAEIDAQEFAKVESEALAQTEEELNVYNTEIQEAQAAQEEIDAQEFEKVEAQAQEEVQVEEIEGAKAEAKVEEIEEPKEEAKIEEVQEAKEEATPVQEAPKAEAKAEAKVEPKSEVQVEKAPSKRTKAEQAGSIEDLF